MEKLNLFKNAIDSLEVGILFYKNDKLKTAHKHAIVNLFHCIELLLKERLAKENPILIYQNPSKQKIKSGSKTISYTEVLMLYNNLGISFSLEDKKTLDHLYEQRNKIIHFEFHPSSNDKNYLGKALKLISDFLEIHLNKNLKRCIKKEVYNEVEDLIYTYEEVYSRAISEAESLSSECDDFGQFPEVIECPDCETLTLVCMESLGGCTMCDNDFDVEVCESCDDYNLSSELDENSICPSCFDYYCYEE